MSHAVPTTCPTCSTLIPESSARCPGCGKVFGEDNRCPHCQATAAIRPVAGGYVCLACQKPREKKPGTVVVETNVGAKGALAAVGLSDPNKQQALASKTSSLGLRFLGIAAMATGVFAVMGAAMQGFDSVGTFLLAGLGALGIGLGFRWLRRGARGQSNANQAHQELRVMNLAEENDGELSVTQVAQALRITSTEADTLLTSMADGSRISVEVTDEGLIKYVFREIQHLAPPRVRVDITDQELSTEEQLNTDQELSTEEQTKNQANALSNPQP